MVVLLYGMLVFFFKQKTAYEMRISDWSSDVCSSDLALFRQFDDATYDFGVFVDVERRRFNGRSDCDDAVCAFRDMPFDERRKDVPVLRTIREQGGNDAHDDDLDHARCETGITRTRVLAGNTVTDRLYSRGNQLITK